MPQRSEEYVNFKKNAHKIQIIGYSSIILLVYVCKEDMHKHRHRFVSCSSCHVFCGYKCQLQGVSGSCRLAKTPWVLGEALTHTNILHTSTLQLTLVTTENTTTWNNRLYDVYVHKYMQYEVSMSFWAG